MMKPAWGLTVCITLAASFKAQAQTMKVYQGQVITAVPDTHVNEVTFQNNGTSFTVSGNTFQVAETDQILIDRTEVIPASVQVAYTNEGAWVTVSADIAPYLDIQTTGNHIRIIAAPTLNKEVSYTLTGNANEGSFYMDGEYKAKLTLSNLQLTNPAGAAIDIANGKRIDVILPNGTESTLADGTGGTHKACLFINGHAEFKGAGTLNLTGNTKHAYASDEYTCFKSSFGTLNILSAVSDGLHIEQYLEMSGGNITITGTQGDCIDVGITKDPLDEYNGQTFIHGGNLNLSVAANDTKGIKTDQMLTLTGGHVKANVSGNGSKGFSVGSDLTVQQAEGADLHIDMDVSGSTFMPGDPVMESKCRGIKVKGNFTFNGGSIQMNVTGADAKGISLDGTYNYISGTTNVLP